MGRSRILISIFKRYLAFLACSVACFLACRKEPDLEKTVPKYLSTISRIVSPNLKLNFSVFLAPNMMIFVLVSITVNLHSMYEMCPDKIGMILHYRIRL